MHSYPQTGPLATRCTEIFCDGPILDARMNSGQSQSPQNGHIEIAAGGSVKAEGLGDGPTRGNVAIAKLRLTLPPVS